MGLVARRTSVTAMAVVLIAATLALRTHLQSASAAVPQNQHPVAYALAGDGVPTAYAIDAVTNQQVAAITLPVTSCPVDIAMTPDARFALVLLAGANCSTTAAGQLVLIDAATNTLLTGVTETATLLAGPRKIAVSPDGLTAYVSTAPQDSATGLTGFIQPVAIGPDAAAPPSLSADPAFTPPPTTRSPDELAVSADSGTLYVLTHSGCDATCLAPMTLTPTASGVTGTAQLAGGSPILTRVDGDHSLVISPDGTTAFLAHGGSCFAGGTLTPGRIDVVDLPGPTSTSIDLSASGACADPAGLAIGTTPDGTPTLYAADASFLDQAIIPIDVASRSPTGVTITVSGTPQQLAATPDASKLEVTTSGGYALSVDLINGVQTDCIPPSGSPPPGTIPACPFGGDRLAMTPDQAPVAALSPASGVAGRPTQLSAASSTVLYGSIATYAWDFGDGTRTITTFPTPTHTYEAPGSYTISVSETDTAGTSASTSLPSTVFTGQTMTRLGSARAVVAGTVTVSPSPGPPFGGDPLAYPIVARQQAVNVVDAITNKSVIAAPIPMPACPQAIAITPDARFALVALSRNPCGEGNSQPSAQVVMIDTTTNELVPGVRADLPQTPNSIAITPDGSTAFVGLDAPFSDVFVPGSIIPIAIAPGPVLTAGAAFLTTTRKPVEHALPAAVAVSPDGSRLYSLTRDSCGAGQSGGCLVQMALDGTPDGPAVPVAGARALVVSPDGNLAFTTGAACAGCPIPTSVDVVHLPGGVTATVDLSGMGPNLEPVSLAIGTRPILSDSPYPGVTDTLYVGDAGDGAVIPIPLNANPLVPAPFITVTGTVTGTVVDLAAIPDASKLEVTTRNGLGAASIDALAKTSAPCPATFNTLPPPNACPVGDGPLAITPDQRPFAQLTAQPNPVTVGQPITLDASGSTVRYGTITRYDWAFGDGATATTPGPTVTHTYAAAAPVVTATVVETDAAGTSVGLTPLSTVFTGQTMSRHGGAPAQAQAGFGVAPSVQTLAGHIYLCNAGAGTTTEVPGGTLAASGPQPLGPVPNPLAPTPVAAGPYSMTATAPGGYTLTDCGTAATNPQQVTVPVGGTGVGVFYVTANTVPPAAVPTLTVYPALGPPGMVTQARGSGFPTNTAVTLVWQDGIGTTRVTTDATGSFKVFILIFQHDLLGPRFLVPVGYNVKARFLVVPTTVDPGGTDAQVIFRR